MSSLRLLTNLFLGFSIIFNVSGMQKLLKIKCFSKNMYVTHARKHELKNSFFDSWSIRSNLDEYLKLKKDFKLTMYNSTLLDRTLDSAIDRERPDAYDVPKLLAIYLGRLKPEFFAAIVNNSTHNNLWKKSYAWDGAVLDTFFKNLDLFSQDKIYEVLGLMVRYKPQHFGMYIWCVQNLSEAYNYIGYDGLKKLYDAADMNEKQYMENAYRLVQKEFFLKDRPIYFLDEILKQKDFDWPEFKEIGQMK